MIQILLWIAAGTIVIFMIMILVKKENSEKNNNSLSLNPLDHIKKSVVDTVYFEQGLDHLHIHHPVMKDIKHHFHESLVGLDGFINGLLLALIAKGHVLVEGVPWLAKTKTLQTLSHLIDCSMKRIQFTPDMLPSDITGVEIFNSTTKQFEVKFGPVFTHIVLADEINRATPKVQSALLEAMQEKQVSLGGTTYPLEQPFFVLATQNPLEQEGTYPLPEAQLDRFLLKLLVNYPTLEQEKKMLEFWEYPLWKTLPKVISAKELIVLQKELDQISCSDDIKDYITRLIHQTRLPHRYIQVGASPRGSLGLMFAAKAAALMIGRAYVTHQDVQHIALAVLRHRVILNYDAKVDGVSEDIILLEVFGQVTLE